MNHEPDQGDDREALRQAMNDLMERVSADVQTQERLLKQDPQAGERAARLRILLNETRKRLENADKPTAKSTGDPASAS